MMHNKLCKEQGDGRNQLFLCFMSVFFIHNQSFSSRRGNLKAFWSFKNLWSLTSRKRTCATQSRMSCRNPCCCRGRTRWSCQEPGRGEGAERTQDGWPWAGSQCRSTGRRGSDELGSWSGFGAENRKEVPGGRTLTGAPRSRSRPANRRQPRSKSQTIETICRRSFFVVQSRPPPCAVAVSCASLSHSTPRATLHDMATRLMMDLTT